MESDMQFFGLDNWVGRGANDREIKYRVAIVKR